MADTDTTRRSFLKGLGATAIGAGIAGCGGDNTDPNTSTTPPTSTSTTPPSTTDSEELQVEIQNPDIEIGWRRDLDQVQDLPDEHTSQATVQTSDGISLSEVELILEGNSGQQTQQRLEPGQDGQATIPATQLSEGDNQVYATNGNTQSEKKTISKQVPDSFLIDLKNNQDWNTIYTFDNFDFSHERIWNKRMQWNQEQAYNDMINTLNTPGEKEDYSTKWVNAFYPEPMRESDGYNTWRKSKFQALTQAEDVIRAASTATQIKQYAIEGIHNRSRENDEFSASVESLINTVHSDEQDYKRKVTTTHVNQVGHGTCIAYSHTDETDLQSDKNWWFVDTTDYDVRPIKEQEGMIEHGYNPFVQGYHGQQIDSAEEQGLTKEAEKHNAVGALGHLIDRTNDTNRWDEGGTITDPMLEFIYNKHIRQQDGDVEPILDMMEKAADYVRNDSKEPFTIIGDNWNNIEFASGQEIYDAATDMDTRLTKDKAYTLMEEN